MHFLKHSLLVFCLMTGPAMLSAQEEDKLDRSLEGDTISLKSRIDRLKSPKDSAKLKQLQELLKQKTMPKDSLMPVNKKDCRQQALRWYDRHAWRRDC